MTLRLPYLTHWDALLEASNWQEQTLTTPQEYLNGQLPALTGFKRNMEFLVIPAQGETPTLDSINSALVQEQMICIPIRWEQEGDTHVGLAKTWIPSERNDRKDLLELTFKITINSQANLFAIEEMSWFPAFQTGNWYRWEHKPTAGGPPLSALDPETGISFVTGVGDALANQYLMFDGEFIALKEDRMVLPTP